MASSVVDGRAARPEPLLAAEGLRKAYPGVVALDDVSIGIRPGELHGLLGENGAGKSTLIKVIGGTVSPDAGAMSWDGEQAEVRTPSDAAALGISVVPQQLAILSRKTVAENVMLGLGFPQRMGWVDRAAGRARTAEVLGALDLDVDPGDRMGDLPLHKRRMVVIALALARKARLVVMDEPTASLNAAEIEVLQEAIGRLRGAGVAVLYVTHRLSEIASGLDWVTVMRNGRVVLSAHGDGVTEDDLVTAIAGRELVRDHARAGRAPARGRDSEQLLELEGVTAGALHDVDLRVSAGRVLGVTGAEGAGTSDLGRALFGALPLAAGRMAIEGRDYRPGGPPEALAAGVVYIAQDRARTGMMARKSVRENCILAPLSIGRFRRPGWRVDGGAARRATQEMIDGLRIAVAGQRSPAGTLSGGNQQKVLLARALMCEPRVLVMDEPTEGVDVGARADFFEIVGRLVDDGRGVVILSTDWEELAAVCDEVAVLREGRLAGSLAGDELGVEPLARMALGSSVAA